MMGASVRAAAVRKRVKRRWVLKIGKEVERTGVNG